MSKGSGRRPTLNKELADKNWEAFMRNTKKKDANTRDAKTKTKNS